jgi:hypothetical protein
MSSWVAVCHRPGRSVRIGGGRHDGQVLSDVPPVPLRAQASAALRARVLGFELLKVNQTTTRVTRGGARPLCQAIPFTAQRVFVRWTGATSGRALLLDVHAPGHTTRTRTLRFARGGTGRRTVELTPRGEGLRDEAFPEGRYVFTVRAGARRLDRTTLTLTNEVSAC